MNKTITMGMKTVSRIAAPVQMPKLKRVAAYARVSMGKDTMLHSLAAQVSYYSDLIQRNPEWEYAGVYADEGLTGTKENRPEFQRMLSDCRAGSWDAEKRKKAAVKTREQRRRRKEQTAQ